MILACDDLYTDTCTRPQYWEFTQQLQSLARQWKLLIWSPPLRCSLWYVNVLQVWVRMPFYYRCAQGICVVTLGASIGWSAMESQLESIPIVQKLQSAGHSDYLKAVGVLVCGFPSIFYFILAFFNQTFRRTLPCTKDVRGDESHLLVTQLAHNQIDAFKHWNWTSVFSKVVWVGFFYFVFAVGVGKFTNLGLSALNQYLGSKDLWFVSLMYFIVGFIMFMLPPVPGIPVYLTGGIVMATAAAKSFGDGDTENFAAGVLYASFMACFIKSCAIVGQMTIIGGKMGKLVSVRRAVGVNSITIRAIKRILSQPGLPMNKIFILVGGPDWPTSVLTGILGCDILQMLLGSTPFLITISVTVLAGAMLLKAGESASMGAAASAMLFIASLVQSGALLAALIAIEDVARQHKGEPHCHVMFCGTCSCAVIEFLTLCS
eukprot:COSAG01_NODE_525_length_15926_cov_28.158021_4_plen_432_part_00